MLRAGAVAAAVLVVALPAAGDAPLQRSDSQRSVVAAKLPSYDDDYGDYAFAIQQTTAEARKAKVQFTFPEVYARGYSFSCFTSADSSVYFGPSRDSNLERCSRDLGPLPLPRAYQNPNLGINGGVLDAYLVTTRGGRNAANTYGSFPPVTVRALVFGSIPVSATVHLEQTVTNGYLDPIRGVTAAIVGIDPSNVGSLAYPGFPRVPPSPTGRFLDLTFKNQVDATLRLRLSDVAVDGRPVDVGARCGTVSPVRLTVREALGYSDSAFYQPPKVRGLPGGFLPLDAQPGQVPGYFDGNADVPAFTQCGSPTEDLDPLLTALISSPTNRVSGFLPVGAVTGIFCDSPIADNTCTRAAVAAQRRIRAVAVAIATHKSPAEIRKLQAKLKPSDYATPKVKPNGDR